MLFIRVAAAAAIAAAASTASREAAADSVGAADAFFTALLGLDHITHSTADYDHKHRNNNQIFHNYFFPVSAYSPLTLSSAFTHR